jgi:hypothetical protein
MMQQCDKISIIDLMGGIEILCNHPDLEKFLEYAKPHKLVEPHVCDVPLDPNTNVAAVYMQYVDICPADFRYVQFDHTRVCIVAKLLEDSKRPNIQFEIQGVE